MQIAQGNKHFHWHIARPEGAYVERTRNSRRPFSKSIEKQFGDLPLFPESLPTLSGLLHISLRDVFWMGGQANPLHPRFEALSLFLSIVEARTAHFFRGCLTGVNRSTSCKAAMVLSHSSCAIEDRRLVVYTYPGGPPNTTGSAVY